MINQYCMIFADFSVNSQQIFMNSNILENFVKLDSVFQKLNHLTYM